METAQAGKALPLHFDARSTESRLAARSPRLRAKATAFFLIVESQGSRRDERNGDRGAKEWKKRDGL